VDEILFLLQNGIEIKKRLDEKGAIGAPCFLGSEAVTYLCYHLKMGRKEGNDLATALLKLGDIIPLERRTKRDFFLDDETLYVFVFSFLFFFYLFFMFVDKTEVESGDYKKESEGIF